MPGDEKKYGSRAEGDNHRIRQPPRHAEINLQIDNGKKITEQAVKQRQSFNRVKIFPTKETHRGTEEKSGCR